MQSLVRAVRLCEKDRIDLLLIAGDLFHGQPLKRELKELNSIFEELTHTKVVMIAGNHDYMRADSYYRKFKWCDCVTMFSSEQVETVDFPELGVSVMGISYGEREITKPIYDDLEPSGTQPVKILLAHGGDEKHVPIDRAKMAVSGFDYIALGHIHKPAEVVKGKAYYPGSLEPLDHTEQGRHGLILGEIDRGNVTVRRIAFAKREYIPLTIEVDPEMTGFKLQKKLQREMALLGAENIFCVNLTGRRDPEVEFEAEYLTTGYFVASFADHTVPAYNIEKLENDNSENLLGAFIRELRGYPGGSVEQEALALGVAALMAAKRD